MDENPYDPHALARRHYRENLWLRSTLESVARELERMAARGQGDTAVLLGRARRVRRQWFERSRELRAQEKHLDQIRDQILMVKTPKG